MSSEDCCCSCWVPTRWIPTVRSRPTHLKRAEILLREAHLARIEHESAAEHHAALAGMYARRAERLQREFDAFDAAGGALHELHDPAPSTPVAADEAKVRHYPFTKPERIERR